MQEVESVRGRAHEEQMVARSILNDQPHMTMVELSARHDAIVAENLSRFRAQEIAALMVCREVACHGVQTLADEHPRRQEDLVKPDQEAAA